MKNKTSIFSYQFTCPQGQIENLIQNWLESNDMVFESHKNKMVYIKKDAMMGNRYFTYEISNNSLRIEAWMETVFGKTIDIDIKNIVGLASKQVYYNEISPLLKEIEAIKDDTSLEDIPVIKEKLNTKKKTVNFKNKNYEKFAIISFVISLVVLVSKLFIPISLGGLGLGILWYLAIKGLKSKKKGFSIAAIVFLSIESIFFLLTLLMLFA